jgi:hypothetical protein
MEAQAPAHLQHVRLLPSCTNFANVFGPDFFVVETFGKGSCFFHALANALFEGYDWESSKERREEAGIALRRSFLQATNEEMYTQTISKVASRLSKLALKYPNTPKLRDVPPYAVFRDKLGTASTWADLVIISFIAHQFNLNLMFWNELACAFYFGVDQLDKASTCNNFPTIFINWRNRSHFELIVRVDQKNNVVERQFFPQRDPNLFTRVRQAYYKNVLID